MRMQSGTKSIVAILVGLAAPGFGACGGSHLEGGIPAELLERNMDSLKPAELEQVCGALEANGELAGGTGECAAVGGSTVQATSITKEGCLKGPKVSCPVKDLTSCAEALREDPCSALSDSPGCSALVSCLAANAQPPSNEPWKVGDTTHCSDYWGFYIHEAPFWSYEYQSLKGLSSYFKHNFCITRSKRGALSQVAGHLVVYYDGEHVTDVKADPTMSHDARCGTVESHKATKVEFWRGYWFTWGVPQHVYDLVSLGAGSDPRNYLFELNYDRLDMMGTTGYRCTVEY